MANLMGIAGGKREIREATLSAAAAELTPFQGISSSRAEFNGVSLAWAAPSSAPLNVAKENDTSIFTLGNTTVSGRDGYYFSLSVRADLSATIRTDTLSLFPVYYYSTPEYFLFSTTPSFFRHFPLFSSQLSVPGLVGILLTNFIVDGQTLLRGVKRLSPQNRLEWKPGANASEVRDHPLVASDRYFGNTFQKNMEIIDSLMEKAVTTRASTENLAVLLSGGLDSRLLAGYLDQVFHDKVCAITQGNSEDFEMKCAMQVALSLGWRHEKSLPDDRLFEEQALIKIRQEHLSSGFNTAFFMQLVPQLGGFSTVFSGVHGDSALGAATLKRVFNHKKQTYDFESHFQHLNNSGLSPETIQKLIPASVLKTGLEEVRDRLKSIYDALGGLPFQKAWLFDLLVADRLQIGFIPRMLAFGAWPSLPFVDRDLLEAVAAMPLDSIKGRKMETELVCQKFPSLAVLRLDRNSYNTTPVHGLKRPLAGLNVSQRLKFFGGHLSGRISSIADRFIDGITKKDRRFYYNTFDLNRPGWKKIRERAERSRKKLGSVLDMSVLQELWPAPDKTIVLRDGITDAQPIKTLLGFALWAEENL